MTFADTSFWLALRHRDDRNHDAARTLWESGPRMLVTTNHVLGESWTYARRKLGDARAAKLVELVRDSARLTVHHVDELVEANAWDWLRRHDEREYSFVDATSFALMRVLRIQEALAFDGDFAAAGFVELRP